MNKHSAVKKNSFDFFCNFYVSDYQILILDKDKWKKNTKCNFPIMIFFNQEREDIQIFLALCVP